MIKSTQRSVRHSAWLSIESISVYFIKRDISNYQLSFQPETKESPQEAKMWLIRHIKLFNKYSKIYGDTDKIFDMNEISADIRAYRFGDAKYNLSRLMTRQSSIA